MIEFFRNDAGFRRDVAAVERSVLADDLVTRRWSTRLEDWLTTRIGTSAVVVKSGTQALELGLRALGVKRGDLVITSPWTFIATCSAIELVGARPLFVNVDPLTWTISVDEVVKAIDYHGTTSRPYEREGYVSAVVAVDLFGVPCDYAGLAEACRSRGVRLLADACQSFGGWYRGEPVGAITGVDATVVSFYPTKPAGGYGEGGALFIRDDELRDHARSLANHGLANDVRGTVEVGDNGRPDQLMAALQLERLRHLDDDLNKLAAIVDTYRRRLSGYVAVQHVTSGASPAVYRMQVVGDEALRFRFARRIAVDDLYSRTVCNNERYAVYRDVVRRTMMIASRTFSLPVYAELDVTELSDALYETLEVKS